MNYYITKYALTKGIVYAPCERVEQCSPSMIAVKDKYTSYFHGEGNEWHKSIGSAILKADEMRRNKISSMKKSIAKLEKINFCKDTVQ